MLDAVLVDIYLFFAPIILQFVEQIRAIAKIIDVFADERLPKGPVCQSRPPPCCGRADNTQGTSLPSTEVWPVLALLLPAFMRYVDEDDSNDSASQVDH